MSRVSWGAWIEKRLPYLLLVPVFVLLFGFALVPSIYSVYLSFTKYNVYVSLHPVFAGLLQYNYMFTKDTFIGQTVEVSLEWLALIIGVQYPLGLGLALILNQSKMTGRTFFRVGFMASYAIPITGIWPIWQRILDPTHGVVDSYLEKLGLMNELHPITWLNSYPLLTIAMVAAWNGFAFGTIVLLARLQSIPKEQHEASVVDGASRMNRFVHIDWPHLMPINVILWLLGIVSVLNTFNIIWVMTGGGPGFASTTLYLYAYIQLRSGDYGYTAAIATLLFAVEMIIAFFYLRYVWFRNR